MNNIKQLAEEFIKYVNSNVKITPVNSNRFLLDFAQWLDEREAIRPIYEKLKDMQRELDPKPKEECKHPNKIKIGDLYGCSDCGAGDYEIRTPSQRR